MKIDNPLISYQKFGDIALILNTDFEVGSKYIQNLQGMNIFTNLPYGIRSQKYIDNKELISTYRRFSSFLESNINILGEVYIICSEDEQSSQTDFVKTSSKLNWNKIRNFDNQGIKVALYKLMSIKC